MSHNVTIFYNATSMKHKIKEHSNMSNDNTGYPESLSLQESCISSECNNIQENKKTINARKSMSCDHAHLATKSTRPQCNISFRLPPIKIKVKQNKHDKFVKRPKKTATNNSKEDQMSHVSHIKWPTKIKTDGSSMGHMFRIGFNKLRVVPGQCQITAIIVYMCIMVIMS